MPDELPNSFDSDLPPDNSLGDRGPLLSQADLDALLSQAMNESIVPAESKPLPEVIEEVSALTDNPADTPQEEVKTLDEAELDALLGGVDADQPLVKSDLDDVLVPEASSPSSDEDGATTEDADMDVVLSPEVKGPQAVDQSDIDALIAMLDADDEASLSAVKPQDEVSLPENIAITLSGDESTQKKEDVSSENLAAAVIPESPEVDFISQELLDSIIEESKAKTAEPVLEEPETVPDIAPPLEEVQEPLAPTPLEPVEAEVPEESFAPAEKAERRQAAMRIPLYFRIPRFRAPANLLKIVTALATGIVAAAGSFAYLYLHPYQQPYLPAITVEQRTSLDEVMNAAHKLMIAGQYEEAAKKLTKAIAGAPEGPDRANARYLKTEAEYRALGTGPVDEKTVPLRTTITELVASEPDHPRAPEALSWLADLHERSKAPYEARRVYNQIFAAYPKAPNLDTILIGAARNALELARPEEAADHMRQLIEQMPNSPHIGEAKLLLANAYAAAGETQAARDLLQQEAQTQANSRLGAEAYLRLGQMAYDAGNYDDAIRQLETRLQTATTIQGNEKVYLLLARSYRAGGRLPDAERVLRELINFFPDSAVLPAANVELSQILEQLGRRADAVQVAAQAAQRYPADADVLKNHAQFLRLQDQPLDAGNARMAAYAAGAKEPPLLLEAARDFQTAKDFKKARIALETLVRDFPESPEAFQGKLELAKVDSAEGNTVKAIGQLEDLLSLSEGRPQHEAILLALADMYHQLGLKRKAAEYYKKIAIATRDQDTLAKAAIAMFDGGHADDALVTAKQVEHDKLSPKTAYAFDMAYARVLLKADPARAIGLMEQARQNQPGLAAPEDEHCYLDALLALDQTAKARVFVGELESQARKSPADWPRFQRTAIGVADYLFNKGDFRAAADMYAQADSPRSGSAQDRAWAQFQRANALLHAGEYDASLPIYALLAQSDSPWAQDAKLKSEYLALQQRLGRQGPVPAEPEPTALGDEFNTERKTPESVGATQAPALEIPSEGTS